MAAGAVIAGCCAWATALAAQAPDRTTTAHLPAWVLSPPRQADALFGSGIGHSAEAADDAARLELAKRVRVRVSEAFEFWEREARNLAPTEGREQAASEERAVGANRRLRVEVESTELRYVEIVARFFDGQSFYSLARLDLVAVASSAQSLLARSSALGEEDYGGALRLAFRAGRLAPLLEAGRAPIDSLGTAAWSRVRALLEGVRIEIKTPPLEWSDDGPLQLLVRLSAHDRPVDLPIRAGFIAGGGTVRIDPPTDRPGTRYVSVLSVARTGAPALLRVEVDLDALFGDSSVVATRFLAAPATDVELRTPRTRVAVVARTDDSGASTAATTCVAGELARFGYSLEAPTAGGGVQVIVEVSSSVHDLWPLTISRQQAAADVRITVSSVQRRATSASLSVTGLRATGATPGAARQAAVERACREAAQRLREIPRWDLP